MSYGNVLTIVDLNTSKIILIVGENLDEAADGKTSNGAGKTTLLNALTVALYDTPVSDDINKDDMVNNINNANMEIMCVFQVDNTYYVIKRARKAKGTPSSYVMLLEGTNISKDNIKGIITTLDGRYENQIDRIKEMGFKDITPDSVNHTNDKLSEILGMPYNIFVNIIVFSGDNKPFLNLPLRGNGGDSQVDIIEELFGLKLITNKAKALKNEITKIESQITMLKKQQEYYLAEKERHLSQIKSTKARLSDWDINKEKEITNITTLLSQISDIDIETEKNKQADITNKEKEISALKLQIKNNITILNDYDNNIKKYEEELSHLRNATCPRCKQHYANSEMEILSVEQNIDMIESKISELQSTTEELVNSNTSLLAELNTLKDNITIDNIDELISISNRKGRLIEKLDSLRNSDNPHIQSLVELENITINEFNPAELDDAIVYLEHQKFLYKILTKKDSFVRKELIAKNIPYLNERLSYYLRELKLRHRVEFTPSMEVSITQLGSPIKFGNFSKGQKTRVNIALAFAFRDVLEKRHNCVKLCFLDEALDIGLDDVGIQNAVRMINHKATQEGLSMFVITHRTEVEAMFLNKLRIQLHKGFSTIVE